MTFFWSRESNTPPPQRIEIEVQVETQVEVDYVGSPIREEESGSIEERPSFGHYSHGSAWSHTGRATTAATSNLYHPSPYLQQFSWQSYMNSLPRSDYDPRRVCLNPCPNFTLGKHRRTIGVYLAGALVSLYPSAIMSFQDS